METFEQDDIQIIETQREEDESQNKSEFSNQIPSEDLEISNQSIGSLEHTPEYLQRKLYFLLEHLKEYHQELPEYLQVRIPHEVLSGIANCLLNDTIFEIVKGLMEIQHVTENHLSKLREQIVTQHKSKYKRSMV